MVSRFLIITLLLYAGTAHAAELDSAIGKALFARNWVSAPSSTRFNDGLGPLYDVRSCAACHQGGGAGRVAPDAIGAGFIVRLGDHQGRADPVYGTQLQTSALHGVTAEADLKILLSLREGHRVVTLQAGKLGYGAMVRKTSLRRAPSLFGVGLLAQIPDSEILKGKGKPAWLNRNGKHTLGRFGWKAAEPDLDAQIAIAFSRDIGLATSRAPAPFGDCTRAQTACRSAINGVDADGTEISDALVSRLKTYVASLPAPGHKSRGGEGEKLFTQTGCSVCHAVLKTKDGVTVPAYSDLLLHHMGRGLSDGVAEGAAKAEEWRTAPLWNVKETLARGGLMHDGRARDVAEAVYWHRGEAHNAAQNFAALTPREKAALLSFVNGL